MNAGKINLLDKASGKVVTLGLAGGVTNDYVVNMPLGAGTLLTEESLLLKEGIGNTAIIGRYDVITRDDVHLTDNEAGYLISNIGVPDDPAILSPINLYLPLSPAEGTIIHIIAQYTAFKILLAETHPVTARIFRNNSSTAYTVLPAGCRISLAFDKINGSWLVINDSEKGLVSNGIRYLTSNTDLTAKDYGVVVLCEADYVVTLPLLTIATRFIIFTATNSPYTISSAGSPANIFAKGLINVETIRINRGQSLTLMFDGYNWIQIAGSAPSMVVSGNTLTITT
jgi:hypothetical protein